MTGVLKEDYTQPFLKDDYYADLSDAMKDEWKSNNGGKTVLASVKEYLVENLGVPVTQLIRSFVFHFNVEFVGLLLLLVPLALVLPWLWDVAVALVDFLAEN